MPLLLAANALLQLQNLLGAICFKVRDLISYMLLNLASFGVLFLFAATPPHVVSIFAQMSMT